MMNKKAPKKAYQPPLLKKYGTVKALTKGGGRTVFDAHGTKTHKTKPN